MNDNHWSNLLVSDGPHMLASLYDVVTTFPHMLASATIVDGKITEWPDYFLSFEDEEPDWDTPRSEVDWAGFEEEL